MRTTIPLRKALADRKLLGNSLMGDSWRTWKILLIGAMGEPLTDAERVLFTKLTGRAHEPEQPVDELVLVIGRKGGKSRAMATLASYLAALCEHDLAPGEKGVVLCCAQNQSTAKVVLDYCEGTFESSPILKKLIAARAHDTLTLRNKITIEVRPSSFRAVRGPTYVAALCDEIAFWFTSSESANPDYEIVGAIRPALGLTNGPLIMASSPYARRGVLWQQFKRHYGADGNSSILVAKGTTRELNPRYPQHKIDAALEEDPALNTSEYLAEFRTDVESFVMRETIEACVPDGVRERAPLPSLSYSAFTDPSGGSSDSFTLAIAHVDGDGAILDAVREFRPPFSPENVVSEFATLLRSYRITKVQGDRYAGEWPRDAFRRCGIAYELSDKPKSELYLNLLPLLNSRRATLLDHGRLVTQLYQSSH